MWGKKTKQKRGKIPTSGETNQCFFSSIKTSDPPGIDGSKFLSRNSTYKEKKIRLSLKSLTVKSERKFRRLHFYSCNVVFFTIHARVVIINGFDNTAEVELHVLLDQPGVKWTEVAVLVVHAAGYNG